MPHCSLCKATLQPEGGTILFTDNIGIPFEVCGTCEAQVDVLHDSKDEAEIKAALDYISEHAEALGNRGSYESMMRFVKEHAPHVETEGVIEDTAEDEEASPEEVKAEKKSKIRDALLLILLVFLLILACTFGGFKF